MNHKGETLLLVKVVARKQKINNNRCCLCLGFAGEFAKQHQFWLACGSSSGGETPKIC